jgi:hypothetical protein
MSRSKIILLAVVAVLGVLIVTGAGKFIAIALFTLLAPVYAVLLASILFLLGIFVVTIILELRRSAARNAAADQHKPEGPRRAA